MYRSSVLSSMADYEQQDNTVISSTEPGPGEQNHSRSWRRRNRKKQANADQLPPIQEETSNASDSKDSETASVKFTPEPSTGTASDKLGKLSNFDAQEDDMTTTESSNAAYGELAQSIDFSAQQEDTTPEAPAHLRYADIERAVASLRLFGYESPMGGISLQGPAVILFQRSADPIQRLLSLVQSFHHEMDRLMPYLCEPSNGTLASRPVNAWKEEVTTRLLTQAALAVVQLSERVVRDATGVVSHHDGGLRFFVGHERNDMRAMHRDGTQSR